MNYYTINPPGELANFIQFFWALEGTASEKQPFYHRALADCSAEWIFYYKGQFSIEQTNASIAKTFTSGIYGQSQEIKKFSAKENFGIFGVSLYPYSLAELFSIPANEFSGNMADLTTLCGAEGAMLEEKIMLAQDNHERAALISEFIRARLRNRNLFYAPLLNYIQHSIQDRPPLLPILKLASDCNLSRRHFERKFKELSGFSPNVFFKVARFNSIIKEYPKKKSSLTQITYAYNFYDQSHFIHDFKKFSGYTPKQYFTKSIDAADYRASVEFKL